MTLRTAAIALLSLVAIPLAHAQERKAMDDYKPALTREDLRSVSPALEAYQNSLLVELWKRPGLTPRDRGIVTLGGDARSACARAYLLRNQL